MSGKPKVEIKRVPSVKVVPKPAPKPVAVKKAKKARKVPPHARFWNKGKWKESPEYKKFLQDNEKKEQPKKK